MMLAPPAQPTNPYLRFIWERPALRQNRRALQSLMSDYVRRSGLSQASDGNRISHRCDDLQFNRLNTNSAKLEICEGTARLAVEVGSVVVSPQLVRQICEEEINEAMLSCR